MTEKKLPEIDRDCPKCGNTRAYGPEYRRGVGNDADLGEHLRTYCTVCRFMTLQPTRDQDTPERRRELQRAYENRPHYTPERNFNREQSDVEQVRRQSTRRWGWK